MQHMRKVNSDTLKSLQGPVIYFLIALLVFLLSRANW
jgi:hypothetical protein